MSDSKRKKLSNGAVGDWPQITENDWYVLAITSAIFSFLAFGAAYCWVFGNGFEDPEAAKDKAQTLAPFGVALFAFVTFCTVAWRGSVNVRQADQAEREGRAKLLQEGAKLLGESKNPPHVSAGIATLEILITGPDARLAIQAMNLVADFIQREMHGTHHHPFRDEAFAALSNGANLGRCANRDLNFVHSDDGVNSIWVNIHGVKSVHFKGGSIMGGVLGGFEDVNSYRYTGCDVMMFESLSIDMRFSNCSISYCCVKKYESLSFMKKYNSSIGNCDFSGASVSKLSVEDTDMLKAGNNYYKRSKPPTSVSEPEPDWSSFLEVRN